MSKLERSMPVRLSDPFRARFEFDWESLDIMIGGKSSIDSNQPFRIQSLDQADQFVRSYGYELSDPIERAEAFGNFHESLNFIRRYFLRPENPDGLAIEVPRKILEITDVRELLVMASQTELRINGERLGHWACSVLKVMHTVAHMDQDLRTPYFSEIQKQIFDRYYKAIHRDGYDRLYLGERDDDPARVDLVAFETKPKKARDSTLLKLLHKPENVAEEVFDRVGIRFVTFDLLGALRVVKYLRDRLIVMPPNLKPSRSRNTLIDMADFRTNLAAEMSRFDRGEISEDELVNRLGSAPHLTQPDASNPHSSEFYRSIQFTARQLVKLKNPIFDDVRELKAAARGSEMTPDLSKLIERLDLKHVPRAPRFFYPYEVQIVDKTSHEENERGRSAHSEYKKSQIQTALRRVMGPLAEGR
jgi:uncharacterized protein (TIGR04562 family)